MGIETSPTQAGEAGPSLEFSKATELEDRYRLLIRENCSKYLFRKSARPRSEDDFFGGVFTAEEEALIDEIDEVAEDLSPTTKARIVNEEKQLVLGMPDSMFLSPRAMDLVKEQWKKCEAKFFSQGETLEMPKEIAGEITNIDFRFESLIGLGSDMMIAFENGEVVGASAFESNDDDVTGRTLYVSRQCARADKPGVGLGMLSKIVDKARELGMTRVTLCTNRVPLGLGNLGFKFVPSDEDRMGMLDYELDLESIQRNNDTK